MSRLFDLAGPRPSPPQPALEDLRRVTRDRWLKKVQATRRRRAMSVAGGLLAAAVALVAVGLRLARPEPLAAPGPVLARVVALAQEGFELETARVDPGEVARVGGDLRAGDTIVTMGRGRVALELSGGPSVRLDRESRLTFVEPMVIELSRGAVYVDSDPARGVGLVELRTPFGLVTDLGTQFVVRLAPNEMRIAVREGVVELRSNQLHERAAAGAELVVSTDGSHELRTVVPHGGEWEWIFDVVPTFDIDGRSAASFLRWAARESGWTLELADEGTAEVMEASVLSGSIDGMTPAEALDLLAPASEFEYQIEGGVLRVWVRGDPSSSS